MKYPVLFILAALYLFIYVGAQNQMMGLEQQSALPFIKQGSFFTFAFDEFIHLVVRLSAKIMQ